MNTSQSRVSRAYPVLQLLGEVSPDEDLLSRALCPEFPQGEFTNGAEAPESFVRLLADHGYETDEPTHLGLLFACSHGVPLHSDEMPSALWVLGGALNRYNSSHQLIVGGKVVNLCEGEVYLFDARKDHGVIASVPGRWAVFSTYIRRKRKPRISGQPSAQQSSL